MNQGPDLIAVPAHRPFSDDLPERRFIETAYGWGEVVKVTRGSLIVSLFKRREDPGKQEFPEWDLMQWADRLREQHIESGYHRP